MALAGLCFENSHVVIDVTLNLFQCPRVMGWQHIDAIPSILYALQSFIVERIKCLGNQCVDKLLYRDNFLNAVSVIPGH